MELLSPHDPSLGTLAIVGVGLIGGSIALAARRRNLARRIVGVGRSPRRLASAVQGGIIDEGFTDVAQLGEVDFTAICTPVDRIPEDVVNVLDSCPAGLVTDAGSVKSPICRQVNRHARGGQFVGAHPLAGSEKGGFEHADPQLFEGRICILTPTDSTNKDTLQRVRFFWESLGMSVTLLSPEEHDRALALSSHLPHVGAAAIAAQLTLAAAPFAATGFRDTTRVASASPELWMAILMENRQELERTTGELIATLSRFRQAFADNDRSRIIELLQAARDARERFLNHFQGGEDG